MKTILRSVALCLPMMAAVATAHADEGMWMLNRIDDKTADIMRGLGLQLTPSQLYSTEGVSLKDAVVDFGDFCSGVVVSPDGLVFTNHHCGYGAIQKLSTPEDDILANGFVARKHSEERPVDGLFVRFLQRTEECTGRVMTALDSLYRANPAASAADINHHSIDSICGAVEKEYSAANPGLDCQVKSYYGGNAYYVSLYKVYNDVRLVFTATETLGKFGGDTDNWMWPRQTCDFSVFRIYAGKDGEPAYYSPDNKPLKAKRYARVSLDGYKPGDYCMTVGYPGSTSRYLSSWGIDERVNARNVSTIQVRGKKQDVWKKFMDADRNVGIKYASKWASSSNYWKNSIGMNKAVKDLDVVGEKKKTEEKITNWLSQDADRQATYGSVLPALEKAYTERKESMAMIMYFNETFLRGIELFSPATRLLRLPMDATAEDAQLCVDNLKSFYKDYEPRVDEETMGTLLQDYRQWSKGKHLPAFYHTIDSLYGGDTRAYARDLFSRTCLLDTTCVAKVMADSTLRENDPAMVYADNIMETYVDILRSVRSSMRVIDFNERLLTRAIMEMEMDQPHYSDANMTMRLSYGFIQDYTANGTHYDYFTNSQSLLDKAAKQAEIEDYELEPEIVKLLKKGKFGRYADKQTRQMQLCFLSNNDITGGNSGSPMFDGNGHVIGLAFDGNWEAMAGDISFDPTLQRCIGVDIRFVLWVIDRWGGGKNIIKELGL